MVLGIKPELFTMTHKACRLKPTCLSPQRHLLVHSVPAGMGCLWFQFLPPLSPDSESVFQLFLLPETLFLWLFLWFPAKRSPPSRGLPNHLLQSRSCLGVTPFLILFSSWNFLPSEICFHCLSVYCLKTLFYSGQRLSS